MTSSINPGTIDYVEHYINKFGKSWDIYYELLNNIINNVVVFDNFENCEYLLINEDYKKAMLLRDAILYYGKCEFYFTTTFDKILKGNFSMDGPSLLVSLSEEQVAYYVLTRQYSNSDLRRVLLNYPHLYEFALKATIDDLIYIVKQE